MTDITIVDNFLANPYALREKAVKAVYTDKVLQDGQLYKRISPVESPEVVDALNRKIGRPISLLGMAFRLNYAGEPPNTDIHTDQGWGKYALVLYLSENDEWQAAGDKRGTAFYTHLPTGATKIRPGDTDTLQAVAPDWNDASKWNMDTLVEGKFNRALIYKSELFHSRWPTEAFGSTPEDGRLVLVAFFN